MIKVGAVNIDVSHPKVFSEVLAEGDRARYVAVYNDGFRGQDEVEVFAKKMNLMVCSTLDELADIVDVAFVHSCNWDKHLNYVQPFIDRNKPVFIDKPIVGNMKDIRKLQDMCANGAKIIGTSALRYCDEVVDIKNKLKELNATPVHTIVTVGPDDFNYAIHAIELICGFYESKPISCRFIGNTDVDSQHSETYFIRFENGSSAQYINLIGKFTWFHTLMITSNPQADADYCFAVDNSKFYKKMLDNVCDYVEGKENTMATCEQMCDAVKIMLAGKASKENGGIEVSLDSNLLEKTSFDGHAFESGYAARGRKIFVD